MIVLLVGGIAVACGLVGYAIGQESGYRLAMQDQIRLATRND
jgi:hypothetical protein